MNEDHERRAFARVQVALAVRYTDDDGIERSGRVENISRGGVLLVVGADGVPEGGLVRITFADEDGADHVVVGRVVRASPEGMLGVTFVELDERSFTFVDGILGSV